MIRLDKVSFQYAGQGRHALHDVSLALESGSFTCLLGASGAGKTTLTRAINGIVPHHFQGDFYGTVTVDGMDTVESSLTDLSRAVGSVLEDIDAQMVSSMVEDELLFGLENFGYDHETIERRMRAALQSVNIEELRHRSLSTLSGGQKQKVAIAAIMALQPKVLLMDEPTGELDPISAKQVYTVLQNLNAQGVTVIVAEQNLSLAGAYADRLVVLSEGRIVMDGPPRQVLGEEARLAQAGLRCPPLAALHREYGLEGPLPLTVQEALCAVRRSLAC